MHDCKLLLWFPLFSKNLTLTHYQARLFFSGRGLFGAPGREIPLWLLHFHQYTVYVRTTMAQYYEYVHTTSKAQAGGPFHDLQGSRRKRRGRGGYLVTVLSCLSVSTPTLSIAKYMPDDRPQFCRTKMPILCSMLKTIP